MKALLTTFTLAALCAAETFAAQLGTAFTYQGRLSDGGAPANGKYDLIFTLHDDPLNPGALGNVIVTQPNTPVSNGLFTVQLDFGATFFNGQSRWLEIGVRTNCNCLATYTFLSPRQPLTPTPQALFAANAAQATTAISASTAYSANSVAWANISGVPAGFADGVDNDTTYSAGAGLSLSGANQFSVNFAGAGNANTAARSDHNHFGANWSGASSGYGLTVVNTSTTGTGLYSQQGTGSGSPAPWGYKAAVWGESSQGDAVYGASGSATGAGVYGYATATSGANYGVYGQSDSPAGVGVVARGSGTSGTALRISNGAIRVTGAGTNSATPAFILLATKANLKTNAYNYVASVIDNPYCNNDPNALVMITPRGNWYPMTAGVMYDLGGLQFATNRWVIISFNPYSRYLMDGDAFNVLVIKP